MECKLVNGEYISTLNGNECSSGFPDLVAAFSDGTAYIVIKNYYTNGDGNGFTMVLNSINGELNITPAVDITVVDTPTSDDAVVVDASSSYSAPAIVQTADFINLAAIAALVSAIVFSKKKNKRYL